MSVKVDILPALTNNYIYVLHNQKNQCVVVDPGEATPVLKYLEQDQSRTLVAILCTHHHHDHIDGVVDLAKRFKVPVWTSKIDHSRIPCATQIVQEGGHYELLGEPIRIIETPGHTLGQVAYWWPGIEAVFVGDTLFSCGCGRLFEGSMEQMYSSLQKLKALPGTVKVFFGHEYTLRNIELVLSRDVKNKNLLKYQSECLKKISLGEPTSPNALESEILLNPFLYSQSLAEFTEWRTWRNAF